MSRAQHRTGTLHPELERFFASRDWEPFDYQRETWAAHAAGASGLVHAPTGTGKTLAVWLGPVDRYLRERDAGELPAPRPTRSNDPRAAAEPIRALWITPLRALAADTLEALLNPVNALGLPWTVEKRTGDTPQSLKAKQRRRLPTALVTTPESLSLLLSYPDSRAALAGVRDVIVDEWHELLSSKRGVQTELGLARLRAWNPGLRTWGLSATLGNLEEARDALLGVRTPEGGPEPRLVTGELPKETRIDTLLPPDMERFPWTGHLGDKMLAPVLEAVERARTTLLFTNTRSQTELWFRAITRAKPEWFGEVAIHHGSLDRDVRAKVEDRLRAGDVRCVVCTSSLDLGVDFAPVDQVIQVGSPKGIARLLQRAGRSGHAPGRTSRVLCAPAHAFELVEFAAARRAADERAVEPRTPLNKPLDVLVQHLVTVGVGGGFTPSALHNELRTTHAFRDLSREEFDWALDFVTRGGSALTAYPQYHRLAAEEGADDPSGEPRYVGASDAIARLHRLAIGTITSDAALVVRYVAGSVLGAIEESFIARLAPGDRFVFAGRVLELVRVKDMTAFVRLAKRRSGAVPRWQGGRSPLSTLLAGAVRRMLDEARRGVYAEPEMEHARPILELQQAWSTLPKPGRLLVERTRSRTGFHTFLFPFEGRLAHEGLGALLAHRVAVRAPISISVTVNDYGIELLSTEPIDADEAEWRSLLSTDRLLDDLLACLNSSELARRRFRDIARIAGLIHPGYPGRSSAGSGGKRRGRGGGGGGGGGGKSNKQLQASSELFFDVFREFDPDNLLLDQARREVLEEQLEVRRLRGALERAGSARLDIRDTELLTPLAFPLWAESLRTQHVSTESWQTRLERMVLRLEAAADETIGTRSGV